MVQVTNLYVSQKPNPASGFKTIVAAFNRSASTGAGFYDAYDVISDSTATAKSLVFLEAGRAGVVRNAQLAVSETVTASFILYLFTNEPTNHIDGQAIACTTADSRYCIGAYSFGNENKVQLSSSLWLYRAASRGIVAGAGFLEAGLPYASPSQALFGLLVAEGAYTPTASTQFQITLGIEAGNVR